MRTLQFSQRAASEKKMRSKGVRRDLRNKPPQFLHRDEATLLCNNFLTNCQRLIYCLRYFLAKKGLGIGQTKL